MQEGTVPGTPGGSSKETILTRRSPTVTAPDPAVPSLRFLRPTPSSLQYLSVRVGFYFLFYFVLSSFVTQTSRPENCEEKIMIPPRAAQLSRVVCGLSLCVGGGL